MFDFIIHQGTKTFYNRASYFLYLLDFFINLVYVRNGQTSTMFDVQEKLRINFILNASSYSYSTGKDVLQSIS